MIADYQKPVHEGVLAFMSRWLTPAQRGAEAHEARAFDPAPYMPQSSAEAPARALPRWAWLVAAGIFAAAAWVASC